MTKWLFNTSCPACSNQSKSQWVHKDCNGNIYIYEDGDLQCDYCSKSGFILDWKFACENHRSEYREPNIHSVLRAIATILQMNSIPYTTFKKMEKKIEEEAKKKGIQVED